MTLGGSNTYGGLGGRMGDFSAVTTVAVALPNGNAARPVPNDQPVRDDGVIEDQNKTA